MHSLESEAAALTVLHYRDNDCDAAARESLFLFKLRGGGEGVTAKRTPDFQF